MHKTGLVFFPAFDWAIAPTHPEREERLLYTKDQLFEEGIMDLPEVVEYTPASVRERYRQSSLLCSGHQIPGHGGAPDRCRGHPGAG
jgi:hypothetical protein